MNEARRGARLETDDPASRCIRAGPPPLHPPFARHHEQLARHPIVHPRRRRTSSAHVAASIVAAVVGSGTMNSDDAVPLTLSDWPVVSVLTCVNSAVSNE